MPIMGSAVCLPTGDYVNARRLLLDDRCLHDPVLCISHVLPEQLPHRNKAVERLIPARDAVGADHRGRIFRVVRHRCPLITALQIMRTSLDITGPRRNCCSMSLVLAKLGTAVPPGQQSSRARGDGHVDRYARALNKAGQNLSHPC